MMTIRNSATSLLLCLLTILISACGTTTGNSLVKSAAFNTSGSTNLWAFAGFGVSDSLFWAAPVTNVTELKFCVKKARLINASDEAEQKNGSDDIFIQPGLVDLSSGAEVIWGEISPPSWFTLKRIQIHLGKRCDGTTEYSARFNGFETKKNLALKWIFNPPISFQEGDPITLSMDQIVASLRAANDEGKVSDNSLKDQLEAVEDKAEKKKKK